MSTTEEATVNTDRRGEHVSTTTHVRVSTHETIPLPPDRFANPYILCVDPSRQQRVTNVRYPGAVNIPCGHMGTHNVCPSWGPVDGCTCADIGYEHGPARATT